MSETTLLHLMFDAGENMKKSLEWEFLDTPPANAWREMLDFNIADLDDNRLHLTDVMFVENEAELTARWSTIRTLLGELNLKDSRITYNRVNAQTIDKIINSLYGILDKGVHNSIDTASQIAKGIEDLKILSFHFHNIKDKEMTGYDQVNLGYVRHQPDPAIAVPFDKSWMQYLTMDTEPGIVYAELSFDNVSWLDMLAMAQDENRLVDALSNKMFGPPTHLNNRFYIPFGPDYFGMKPDFYELLFKKQKLVKRYMPEVSVEDIFASIGRIPVAKFNENVTMKKMFTPDDLRQITGLFKAEFYQY